ncbi:MAG: nuclear transport factor 2 family protein [Gemmatimonadaceae bacterium]|nr:nuclear transport factor 2 family protein [Gemmatimonadaceae bacterium]
MTTAQPISNRLPRAAFSVRRLKPLLVPLLAGNLLIACTRIEGVPPGERRIIADSLSHLITAAYDFTRADAPTSLLSLYPDSGRVISAAAGSVITTRDSLDGAIRGFWTRVGQNMRKPQFVLGSTYVDVITRDAAVMTITYSIPHTTPAGNQHIVSGAWTMCWRRTNDRWQIVQEHLSDTPESTMPSTISDSAPQVHRH